MPKKTLKRQKKQRGGIDFPFSDIYKAEKAKTALNLTRPVRYTDTIKAYNKKIKTETETKNDNIKTENDNIKTENDNIKTENDNIKTEVDNIQPEADNIQPEADNIQNALKKPGCAEVVCRSILGALTCVCKAPVLVGQAIAALASGGTRKKQIRKKPRKNKTSKKQYK